MQQQSAFWSYEHRQYGRGVFNGEINVYHTKNLQLSLVHRSIGFFARGGLPIGTTIISFPLLNTRAIHYRGATMQDFQALALRQDEEFEIFTTYPTRMLTIAVDTSLLERKTFSILGVPFSAVRSQDRLTMNSSDYSWQMGKLTSLLKFLTTTNEPSKAEEQGIENEIIETVLLGTVPPGMAREPADRDFRAKKAEEYIRNNLDSPITIEVLCRHAETTPRTLHLGFKERFGVSPKAYVQIMRLNRARKLLLDNQAKNNIAFFAINSGYSHLGHFTEQYRRMFGETPSDTREKAK